MKRVRVTCAVGWLALLAACGGGGGGEPEPPVPTEKVLSGRIAVAETAAVDSDTNDVQQTVATGRSANNSIAAAQPLTSPLMLVGTVNRPGTGPAGPNRIPGDENDFFRVRLAAGQVVELEFAADPAVSDVDLYVFDTNGTRVGASTGQSSRFECVAITRDGEYYVNVHAYSNASIYNLRIGAPGTAGSCANQTTAADFDPHELLAQTHAAQREQAASVQRLAGVATEPVAADDAPGPRVLRLPASARERVLGLRTLQRLATSSPSVTEAGAPSKALPTTTSDDEALPASVTALRYAKALRASGAYRYVQPNWIMQRHAFVGAYPPNDRNYIYQRWHYEQINLPAAMARLNALTTLPTVRPIVAVIDDGVVRDHPDFAGQLLPGCKFVADESPAVACGATQGDNPATPEHNPIFHGTHVAGTVAAATAFAGDASVSPEGGAGVAPMAQVMPLRVFPVNGGARSSDIIQAMRYAARLSNTAGALPARRADVINLSLGGDRACDDAYADAIAAVRGAGTLVVVSSGNSARNEAGQRVAVGAPANCPGAWAVGATDARQQLASYANTGEALDVAAPGGDSRTSTTGTGAPDSVYSDLASFDANGTRRPSFGGMMGTSMAAPHVSGVLALMRFVNPALTVGQIDGLLMTGALTDDLGVPGRDNDFGWGLINARKAVDAALASLGGPPPPEPPVLITASPSALDFGSFQSEASFELRASGTPAETVVSITSDHPAVTVTPAVHPTTGGLGVYTVRVNRGQLGGTGSFFPRLTVTLSPARTLTIQLSVTQPAAGAGARSGDYGPVYVLLLDPDTQEVLHTVLATRAPGGYTWRHEGFAGTRVSIIAGGDLDNDDYICQRGEPCGGYPVLGAGGALSEVDVSHSRTDLDFQVAPLSGIAVAASVGQGHGPSSPGWRRQRVEPEGVNR